MSKDSSGRRGNMPTQRGYATPRPNVAPPPDDTEGQERTQVDGAPEPPEPEDDAPRGPRGRRPPLHVEVVHVQGAASLVEGTWRAVEIWTRNRIYALDQSLVCIDVVDQGTRKSSPDHPFIGARLVGGQRRDGSHNELSHPFPVPGSEAVFERYSGKRPRLSQTSTVTRVVLRMRIINVAPDYLDQAWDEITGSHPNPSAKK